VSGVSRSKQFSAPGLPLTPAVFYIMLSVRDRNRHGYQILKDVQAGSMGKVRLGPATLYTTLKRLLDAKVISEVEGPADDDPRRRYYKITRHGQHVLTEELERMEEALALARRKPADIVT
jgi:DNA-binding PadR family transcriptional regulator